MIILLGALLIGFIVSFIIDELIDIGILAVIGGVVAGVVFLFGMFMAIDQNAEKVTKRNVTELIALSDGSQTTGRMFLGSGYIDGELTYRYAYKKGEGYAIDTENASYIDEIRYIKDGSKPRIESREVVYRSTLANFFTAPFFESGKYIYVPEGTIQESFNIDLQQ
ncbi:Uncharacterized protein BCRIVMBC845_06456 [Bacillus cereus]|nr:Uncharacterized protein BCRIVMBC845_06456 [Bacillus cereus]